MQLYGLNSSYDTIGDPIDNWSTAMWYKRYDEEGEMSIYLPPSFIKSPICKLGNYIVNMDFPDDLCIIESIETKLSIFGDRQCVISGRNLSSLLRRRIIWDKLTFEDENFQNAIETILDDNIINPSDPNRAIDGFVFTRTDDSFISSLTITGNFKGENIYDVIKSMCQENNIGFKICPHGIGGFEFMLYRGIDRSYAQDLNPYVVFSNEFENLSETKNTESTKNFQNMALVYNSRTVTEKVEDPETQEYEYVSKEVETNVECYNSETVPSGIDRREIFVRSSVSNRKSDDTEMSDSEYRAALNTDGLEELQQYAIEKVYTGEIDPFRQFVYGSDFYLGDIVQFVNEYGQEGSVRITEIIHSSDKDGEKITPTFINV